MRKLTQRMVMISIGTIAVFGIVEAFSLRSLIPIISNNIATIVSPARYVQVGEEMTYSVSHNEAEPTVQEVLNGLQLEVPDGEGLTLNVKAYKDTEDQWSMTGNITQSIQPDSVLGLVGRWKADALSGTYDSGDYVLGWSDSSVEYALDFDGDDDIVTISDINHSLTTLSAFAWINTTDIGNTRFFGHHNSNNDQRSWSMGTIDGEFIVLLSENGTNNSANLKFYRSDRIDDGEWHHVGFTWNNGVLKLYIDGQEATIGTKTHDASFTSLHDSTSLLSIGAVLNTISPNVPINGTIYGASIWNQTLSSGDISDLYAVGTVPADDLVAYRPMNEGIGDTIYDMSSNNYTGTIGGNPIRTTIQNTGNDLFSARTDIEHIQDFSPYTLEDVGDNLILTYGSGTNQSVISMGSPAHDNSEIVGTELVVERNSVNPYIAIGRGPLDSLGLFPDEERKVGVTYKITFNVTARETAGDFYIRYYNGTDMVQSQNLGSDVGEKVGYITPDAYVDGVSYVMIHQNAPGGSSFTIDELQVEYQASPMYVTNAQNGLPAVRFDSGNQERMFTDTQINLGTENTILMAYKIDDSGYSSQKVLSQSASQDQALYMHVINTAYFSPNGVNAVRYITDYRYGDSGIWAVRRDGASVDYYEGYNLFGLYPGWTDNVGANVAAKFQGISTSDDVGHFHGDVYELLIYDKTLSREELGDIQTYLREKRGLEN